MREGRKVLGAVVEAAASALPIFGRRLAAASKHTVEQQHSTASHTPRSHRAVCIDLSFLNTMGPVRQAGGLSLTRSQLDRFVGSDLHFLLIAVDVDQVLARQHVQRDVLAAPLARLANHYATDAG